MSLPTEIRSRLRAAAAPDRAPAMQAYMKSSMPFLGVGLTTTRALSLKAAKQFPPTDLNDLVRTVRDLWDHAAFREERYSAQALLRLRLARGRLQLLDLHHDLIVAGDWWDHTDEAMHRIGELLAAHPIPLGATLRAWSRDGNRWLRRSSVIAQLDARSSTDTVLLTDVIEANLADPDFFLRKAIGWALRQYARVDPDWVGHFVADHPTLSPLSRREALKHL